MKHFGKQLGVLKMINQSVIGNIQYIKDYDVQTFEKIISFHKEEDFKLKLFKLFNKKKFKKYTGIDYYPIDDNIKLDIISKALKFAGIDLDTYIKYQYRDKNIKRMTSQKDADKFWADINEKWLCMNIDLQLHDYAGIYNAFPAFIYKEPDLLSICDYGCGSAALSFALNSRFHFKKMDLYDIDNYTADYVKYTIKQNDLNNTSWFNIIDEKVEEQYDFVICLDVLEHLENSFNALKRLKEKTKTGGYLVLKIAFECNDPTHLPQAAKNFFIENDGMRYLKDNFKLVKRFQRNNIVNGIYKKIV